MIDRGIVKDMVEITQQAGKGTSAYDTTAEVVRVEDGTAWVHIPGGVDETPAAMSINAQAGDAVRVRVSGGQAWVMGNDTAPPTDDRTALAAQNTADQAIKDADRARTAAAEAETSAVIASEAATNAVAQATTATTAANSALTQLSVVEDVVGTLNWISEHGTYTLTTDTAVVAGKMYFTRTGSGTDADPYVYTIVTTPASNPQAAGYYELTDVDEAVSNYVSTHLALTDEGLFLVVDDSGYRLKLTNTGAYIIDPSGNEIAGYSTDITIGNSSTGTKVLKLGQDGLDLIREDGGFLFSVNGGGDHLAEKTHSLSKEALAPSGSWNMSPIDRRIASSANIHLYIYISDAGSIYTKNLDFTSGQTQTQMFGNLRIYYNGRYDFTFTRQDSGVANWFINVTFTYNINTGSNPFYSLGLRMENSTAGAYSVAEGYNTQASGGYTHAEGNATYAVGLYSHAEGYSTWANERGTHAEGTNNAANGVNSHAEGFHANAYGVYSHVQNEYTIAHGKSQTVIGRYNTPDPTHHTSGGYGSTDVYGEYALIIGNGTSTSARSNALTVDWDGNAEAAGDITDGSGNVLADKADAATVTAALADKADTATVTAALADKADTATVTAALAEKVDMTDPMLNLDTTAASGTTDGDLYAAITGLGWESEVITS